MRLARPKQQGAGHLRLARAVRLLAIALAAPQAVTRLAAQQAPRQAARVRSVRHKAVVPVQAQWLQGRVQAQGPLAMQLCSSS